MLKTGSRLLILLLMFTMILSIYSGASITYAAEPSPNVVLLDSILNNRQWVIQTLVNDNYTNSPYARINNVSGGGEMSEILSRYQDSSHPDYSAAYKAMVDIMEKVYDDDDYITYVTDFIFEFGDSLLSLFIDATSLTSNTIASVSELQYERIIQEVLAANYTSSHGTTLKGTDSEYANMKRLQEGVKNLRTYSTLLKNVASDVNGSAADNKTITEYVDGFLLPYIDSIDTYLDSLINMGNYDNPELLKVLFEACVVISVYDRFSPAYEDSVLDTINDLAFSCFLDEVSAGIINAGAGLINFSAKSLDSYMFVQNVQSQKSSLISTFERVSNGTPDPHLKDTINYYISVMDDSEYSSNVLYQAVINYLRNESVITDLASKYIVSNGLKALSTKIIGAAGTSSITSAFSSISGVLGISGWCADRVVGLESTCKKTYELKYLDKIINAAKSAYNDDLWTYEHNKTDEYAQKVLDDLQFLQKLRLRGEKIAYEMTVGQINSWIGKLLSNGSELGYWDWLYQTHVDILLGASIMPLSAEGFTVENGSTLNILFDSNYGGLYGKYTKTNGDIVNIPELALRTAKGLYVNGGTVNINAATGYIPFIEINNGTINYNSEGVTLSELAVGGGTVNFVSGKTYYIDNLQIKGGSTSFSNDSAVEIKGDITHTSGTLSLQKGQWNIDGDYFHAGGYLYIQDARLNISGDYLMQSLSGNSYSSGYLYMQNEASYLYIDGNCIIDSQNSSSNRLTAGTIEIKGDFIQKSDFGSSSFAPSGTHKVLLSGTEKQTVFFNRPDYSHFNILEITNASGEGVEFATSVVVKTLFNHNRNNFTLMNGSTFPDYDKDGISDHIDPYPLDPNNRGDENELENIIINDLPLKTVYNTGEPLDLTGLTVTAVYSDSSEDDVSNLISADPENGAVLTAFGITEVTISYIENSIIKTFSVNISNSGNVMSISFIEDGYTEGSVLKTAVFDVMVYSIQPILDSISVTAYPDKTIYDSGDTLDPSGLIITAYYSDGSVTQVTDYITNPADGAKLDVSGIQSIEVSYNEDGITKTTLFSVSVDEIIAVPLLDSISVSLYPEKTVYYEGENIDLFGLIVNAHYSDGNIIPITDYTTNPIDGSVLNTVGTQTVIVYYEDRTIGFSINVNAKEDAKTLIQGDVSGDGTINMQDVLLIYQYFRGKIELEVEALTAADVSGDGDINMQDVLMVYQYFRGMITSFYQ